MKISIHCFLALCLFKLTLSLPTFDELIFNYDPEPLFFEIAPRVEKVTFEMGTSKRNLNNSPFVLGYVTKGHQPNEQRSRPLILSHAPRIDETSQFLDPPLESGSGSGSSDESFFGSTTFGIPLNGVMDGSGAAEVGSGRGNGDIGIVFPNGPSAVPTTTVASTSGKCNASSGLIHFKGGCHRLLKRGPCAERQWVIVNKQGFPRCADRPCPAGQLFYNRKMECVNVNDSSVCNHNEVLYVDFTANVYCDCQPDFIYDANNRRCYAEHERGSCPFGQFLEIDPQGHIQCVHNPCQREDLFQDPKTKKCFNKLFKGRCPVTVNPFVTLLLSDDGTAKCISIDVRNIFEVPALTSCPTGSKRDYFGNCRTIFRLASDNPLSYRIPSQLTSRYTACPPNYTKYPDGTCKKVHDLFQS